MKPMMGRVTQEWSRWISFGMAAVYLFALAGPAAAETKKDISDPVLQEVINSYGSRMPRFVDKHGKDVFVADGPVTRGALMMALYEYDKSLKLPKKEYMTKQEVDELITKRVQLTGGKHDIAQIINELQPNMPLLLDGSLNSSKVFLSLKSEIARSAAGTNTSAGPAVNDDVRATVEQTRDALSDLTRRVYKVEKEAAAAPAVDTSGKLNLSTLSRTYATKDEMQELIAKIGTLERTMSTSNNQNGSVEDLRNAVVKNQKDILIMTRRIDDVEGMKMVSNTGESVNTKNFATKRDIEDLYARLSSLEKNLNAPITTVSSNDYGKEISRLRKDIVRLDRRINDADRPAETISSGPSNGAGYATMLTKVSLGLSMVAALFIAR